MPSSSVCRAAAMLAVAALGAAGTLGCDTLFPEFAGTPHDAAASDDALGDGGAAADATPHLAGTICVLGDARDYRSCASAAPGLLRVTVEETRQQTMTDVAGHFTLPLSQKLESATVAVVDPHGTFAVSVLPLRLTDGVADGLALPVIAAQTLSDAALQNGSGVDPTRAIVLAWAVDPSGTPLAGVSVDQPTAIRDGSSILMFDLAPPLLTLTLTPPPGHGLRADSFALPLRAGAVTMTTLPLPPQ